ncbi:MULTISPECIES: recombinase family protein [Bacillus]|uniref:recombinase family protein n=1 Tax=Bacillus TaxID=1386 RepID=UPI0015748AB5|nr:MULTISPECIES: recombinase family protein [Bacillus]MBC6974874.1 recombinase family protein [Bacillus sp. Xin]MBY0595128.1 recombinase family protein [Bacillus bingmayongensis]NSW39629.1 recombinase family protein [Bacillus sp. Xin1]
MKIGYARVSTQDQNLDMQVDELQKNGCERIYQEKISGAKQNRQELKIALDMLREGDTFVIYKLDRLARSVKQLYEIMDIIREKNVHFISLKDNIDTSTASGRAMFGMFAVFAEFERDIIRERTVAGLDAARARGRKGGRPKTDKKKTLQAIELYKSKKFTVEEIKDMTGVSRSTLYREMKNEEE